MDCLKNISITELYAIGLAIFFFLILILSHIKKTQWLIREFVRMYSAEPSFFSKKRIEGGIAFIFAFQMTAIYLQKKIDTMDVLAFGYILTTWLVIAGYTVNKIQQDKVIDGSANKPIDAEKKEPSNNVG